MCVYVMVYNNSTPFKNNNNNNDKNNGVFSHNYDNIIFSVFKQKNKFSTRVKLHDISNSPIISMATPTPHVQQALVNSPCDEEWHGPRSTCLKF